jgi:hypothetical protein
MRRHVVAASLLVVACSAEVEPTNPYDLATPPDRQAKAIVRGALEAPTLGSPAGLTVFLRANHQIVKQVQTAGDGAFLVEAIVPGAYAVEAAPQGFVPVVIPVTLAPGQDLDLGTLTLAPLLGVDAATLSGTVTLQGQSAHGGILVEVVGRAFTALTDSSGAFQLEVPEGTYQLRMTYPSFVFATVSDVVVGRGETRVLDPVVLAGNPATVSGEVEAELPAGGYAPLADAVVTLEGGGVMDLTGSDGSFSLPGAPAGSWLLRVVKVGYDAATYPVLNLEGGELRAVPEPIRLALARGRLEGRIALADATDAGGTIVEVTGTGRAAVTASDGTFSFDGLVSGTYEITVRRDGYGGQVRSGLAVPPGGTATVATVTLARQGGAVSIDEAPYVRSRSVTLRLTALAAVSYKASEDPSFATTALGDVDWVPYGGAGATRPFTLSDADGEHAVYVVYFDGTSPSMPASARVVLDRKAPDLPAVTVNTGGAYASDAAVTLALSAQDRPASEGTTVSGLSKVHVSNSSDFVGASVLDYNVTVPWSLTTGDDPKTVWVRFVDRAGNVSAPASAGVILDTTPPTGTLALAGTGGFAGKTGSPIVTATLGASDANAGAGNANLSVRLSSSLGFAGAVWQPFSSSMSWVLPPGDGTKTVYAQLRDAAGNESSPPASDVIDLLTTPPSSGTLTLNGGSAATSSATVSCAISAVGAAEMRLFVNGVAATGWIPYATTTSVNVGTTPDQATRVLAVSFRNGAGVEGGAASAGIRYDATAPGAGTLSLVGSLGNGSTSTAISSSAIVVANVGFPAAADAIEMALAQAATGTSPCSGAFAAPAWQPVARTATIPLTGADGDKRVCALFRDAAGNVNAASAVGANIVLDTTPPTNPAFVNVASGTTREDVAPAAGLPVVTAATDAGPVTYQCVGGWTYGANWADCGTATTLPSAYGLTLDGETTLGVRARDAAYNYSPGSFARVVQDSTAPFPPFITSIRSSRDSVTVSWEATGDADVSQYLVHYGNAAGRLGGTGAAQGASPVPVGAFVGHSSATFTLTGLTPGLPYYVAVEAIDAAGNRSGPSGERLAVPARANPRVVSTFGGRPRAVAIVVETFDDAVAGNDRTFAYLGENQAIVQLDVSSDASLPAVLGRAFVPDLVPDDRNGVVAFRCQKGTVKGHCVVAAGVTLEGDYRDDRDSYRAAAPVVFFPRTGVSTAPVVGTVESILPVRPSFVFQGTGPYGETLLYTVDRAGLRAFSMKAGQLSLLREVARHDFTSGVESILGATLAGGGTELHVYARLDVQEESAPVLYSFEVVDAWDGAIYPMGATVLLDSATAPQHALGDLRDASAPEVVPAMNGGIYMAFHGPAGLHLASYVAGDPLPQSKVLIGVDGMMPIEALGAAGVVNGHLYVLLEGGDDGYAASLVPVSGGGVTLGTPVDVPGGAWPIGGGGCATLNHLGQERLHAIAASNDSYALQRWTVSGTTATPAPAATFEELPPTWFAEADRFLYLSHGSEIRTLDVSNPLTPTLPVLPASYAGRTYGKLVVHGRFLYAIAGGSGVDIYRRNGNGSLTYRANVNPGWAYDAAVVGRYLFVAGGGFVSAYDVGSIATGAPAAAGWIAAAGARAIDARVDSTWGTSHAAVVYVSQGSDGAASLVTYRYSAGAFASVSSATYPGDLGTAVTVRGDYTTVSASGGTWLFSGGPYPSLTSTFLPVAGPTLLQAGYVVGLAREGDPNGPAFALRSSGAVEGAIRFQVCGPQAGTPGGSLAHASGLYAASCGRNGITLFTPAAPEGGRLHKAFDVMPTWSGGVSLASDGMYSWFGGPMYGTDRSRLYYADEQLLDPGTGSPFAGAYLQNATFTGPDPGREPRAMAYVDGALFIATYGTSTATIDAYDPTGWVRLGRLTLAGSAIPTAVVTDGDYLYVARTSQLDVVDVRNPAAMTLRATASVAGRTIRSLAYARDRLYAGLDLENETIHVNEIRVWDVSSIHAGTLAAKATIGPWEGSYVGLAVSGQLLFATLHDWNFRSPLYGLITIRLGATDRDGNGAFSLGVVESDQPLASPTVVGDTLYVAGNLGTRTYDLTALWQGTPGSRPVALGGVNLADPFWTDGWLGAKAPPPQLRIEGPFGFLVGGTYRVFDLR